MSIGTFFTLSLLATTVAAFAAPAGAPKIASADRASAIAVAGPSTKQVPIASYSSLGTGPGYLPQFTFTTVATSKVNCPNAAGCSIGIEAMNQMHPGAADWAICLRIDGASVSCQYQGLQPKAAYVVGNARGWGQVSQGTHVVETQLYTDGATAQAGYFQTDVRVYKP